MGEDAASIDICHQNHGAIDGFGEAHVGDVAVAQIDFRRTARAFDDHAFILRAQPAIGFQYGFHGHGFVAVIIARMHVGAHLAVHDDLRAGVAGRLEQNRVHVGVRRQSCRLRLQGLGAADFAAVRGHRAVERHVLRLERNHGRAGAQQQAAQRCGHGAFAGVGGGALHHQCRIGKF